MQTIIIVLDPGELVNPDLDLRYCVPDRIAELTNNDIRDNGYDYIDTVEDKSGPLMGIWLETENAGENWPAVLNILQNWKNFWIMICPNRPKSISLIMKRKILKIVSWFTHNNSL